MEITIESQKYINAEAPVLTKKMIDWLFLTLWTTRLEYYYKKIESIDIIANTAFNGSGRIHFYVTINKDSSREPFHRVYEEKLPLWLQCPPVGFDFRKFDVNPSGIKKKRRDWVEYFVRNGVDCGELGIKVMDKIQKQREYVKKRDEEKLEKEMEQKRYKAYLRLKEEFEP